MLIQRLKEVTLPLLFIESLESFCYDELVVNRGLDVVPYNSKNRPNKNNIELRGTNDSLIVEEFE